MTPRKPKGGGVLGDPKCSCCGPSRGWETCATCIAAFYRSGAFSERAFFARRARAFERRRQLAERREDAEDVVGPVEVTRAIDDFDVKGPQK